MRLEDLNQAKEPRGVPDDWTPDTRFINYEYQRPAEPATNQSQQSARSPSERNTNNASHHPVDKSDSVR